MLHHCTTSTARLPSLVFCLAPATPALTNYGGRSVSVRLSLRVCVCLCVFSDVDVEVYKMHNLALPFHQLPFSSCPACLSFPPLLLPLSLPLSLRLVSSLRLFFIFILAFVFIDSQVVWLFHFSFGRKTFDLPPPSPTRTHTPASAHPHTPSTHS